MKTDLEIGRETKLQDIREIAKKIGIPEDYLELYGKYKAKIKLPKSHKPKNAGKLILMTAMTPTPAGEGKTTTTIGLTDALNMIGKKTIAALREPSLGPCFGVKGGACGGGYSQVLPMEDINLHFNGDFHAITSANNLLAAMIDNHIYWENSLQFDTRKVVWNRCIDMNDRALREVVVAMGGEANGFPRAGRFDITVASEIMAVMCLSKDIADLKSRLDRMIVGYTREDKPIYARDLKATGSMAVLLKDALLPNLVQTAENSPAILHCGPFANIAHGCNSLIATNLAMSLADYTITEAGFGSDLGAVKFFDIKSYYGKLKPNAVVLVSTIKATKMHGGVALTDLKSENLEAIKIGFANVKNHINILKNFNIPIVIALNHFYTDTDKELALFQELARAEGIEAIISKHFAEGGAGAEELAKRVVEVSSGESTFRHFCTEADDIETKITKIATKLYQAGEVIISEKARNKMKVFKELGLDNLPICIAKTQYSFSTDPSLKGAPVGHKFVVADMRVSNGAGFIVVLCGDIMTMPGLGKVPSAERIFLDDDGMVQGLS